jgi:hypothetical protein
LAFDSRATLEQARALVALELPVVVGADRYLYDVAQCPMRRWRTRNGIAFRTAHLLFAGTDAELDWIRAGGSTRWFAVHLRNSDRLQLSQPSASTRSGDAGNVDRRQMCHRSSGIARPARIHTPLLEGVR